MTVQSFIYRGWRTIFSKAAIFLVSLSPFLGTQGDSKSSLNEGARPAFRLSEPARDSPWQWVLLWIVRFAAWLLGSVYTSGAMAIVIRDDGKILLVKPRYRKGWGLPGGFMKWGEQSADTLRRELAEETGLEIESGSTDQVYVQQGRRHIDHLYILRVDSEQETRNPSRLEIGKLAWHRPDDLPPLQSEALEAIRRAFD